MSSEDITPIPMTIEQATQLLEQVTANASPRIKRAVEVLSRSAVRGQRASSTSNQRVLDIANEASKARESSQKILEILHVGNVEAGIVEPRGEG